MAEAAEAGKPQAAIGEHTPGLARVEAGPRIPSAVPRPLRYQVDITLSAGG